MAYKALYRTYRPQIFSDVTGQEVVVKTLQNAIINNKISHAYLFSGPRGTGKTSVARIFAKALNCCDTVDGEPCDKCISCQEISDGINPDVIEIDAASNNGVDEIRDIREKVKFLPSGSKYKIYIIDEVHMLSGGAFNALLKTLEEPPKHVVFILATTEPQKLPATIISRCQRFEFKALTVEEISERVKLICKLEDVSITEEALNSIGESAEGGMRDALSILDQAISYGNKEITIDDINEVTGSLSFEKIITLAKAIEEKDVQVTLECVNELIGSGKEISKIINSLLVFYRDVLLYKSVGTSGFNKFVFTKDKFQELCLNIPMSKIMYFVDVLSDIQNKVRYTTTPNVFLEIALIKMCNISVDELDIMKRVTELENKLNSLGDVDFSNMNAENSQMDNAKIIEIEERIDRIINGLNRFEIPKQIDKINALEQNLSKVNMQEGNVNLREIESELGHLKDKVEEMDLFVNKESTDAEIPDEIYKRLEALEQSKQTNSNSNNDANLNLIVDKIKELELKLETEEEPINDNNLDDLYERVSALENSEPKEVKVVEKVSDGVDLTGVYDRLEALENNTNKNIESCENVSENIDLSSIYSRLETLENSVKNEINNINQEAETEDLTPIYNRLNALENRNNSNDNLENINGKISELETSLLDVIDDIDDLKEKANKFENRKIISGDNVSEDLSEISDKLMFLERRVYQIMAGELANKKPTKKITKKNDGQIMLFGDDILSLNNIDVNKEDYDFDDLEKTEEEKELAKQEKLVLEQEQNNEVNENRESIIESITENNDNSLDDLEKDSDILNEESNNLESNFVNKDNLEEKDTNTIDTLEQPLEEPLTNSNNITNKSELITGNFEENKELHNAVTNSILNEESKMDLFTAAENLKVSKTAEPIEEKSNLVNDDLTLENREEPNKEEINLEDESINNFNEIKEEPTKELNNLFDASATINQEVKEEKEPIQEEPTTPVNNHYGLFETASSIIEKPVVEKKSNNIVSEYFDVENNEQVINRERSSLVVREKAEVNEDYELEKDLIAHENNYHETEVNEPTEQVQENFSRDKFATYNIKYIEQIMHDSRSIESRNDKVRIEQLWKVMTRGARPEYLSLMETLQAGKIAVVGNKEFILVFPNVTLCNQVMRAKFKDIAIRILYNLLGDTYNYIALPIDVWTQKSIEYKQQYQIGIKYPTLKPLDIRGLEILTNDEEYKNEQEKAINQTIKMFGKDNINFE